MNPRLNLRRAPLRAALAVGLVAALPTAAVAQSGAYPTRAITIVVPFAPGGGIDVLTRAVGAKLVERWKQPVVVVNKGGAGSSIGTAQVATAAPDGYTLLATVNQTMVGNRFLYKKLPYDPERGFEPIMMLTKADQLIVANAQVPVESLKDLVQLARNKPGTLTYGSFGSGSQPHLLFSLIAEREQLQLTHVPYNGITPNLTALASGEVQFGSASAAVIVPHIQSGRIKPVAVAGDARSARFPNVPTTAEQGFPYAKASIWYGLFAPAGTPEAIIEQVRAAVREILLDPAFGEQNVAGKGLDVVAGDGRQLKEAIAREVIESGAMIRSAGIQPE